MPAESALVGRDGELDRLAGWVDDVVSGTGRTVLIEGEPGIGKSAVVRAAVSMAERRGCQVHWAAADEFGQALPLQPLLDAFGARGVAAEPRLTTILRLLHGEVTGVADPALAASEQLLTLVTDLCSVAPTVLVVDDLQWADQATIGVWETLARSAGRSALLLVGVVRPVPRRVEVLAARRTIDKDCTIHLRGLSDEAVSALVASISAGEPGENLLALVAEAAGNPLYVTELLDTLIRARRLARTGDGVMDVLDGPVPHSLAAVITSRLDFLPSEVRPVLQAAALLGADFLVAELVIVTGRRVTELVPAIDEARACGILRDAGEKLAFRHPLIRRALYDDLAEAVRPAWHLDAARSLARAGVPPRRVARQLLHAVSSPGAGPLGDTLLDWLAEAAPTLIALAPRAAADLLRQACHRSAAPTKRGAVLACRLADALFRTGESTEAERVATRAMASVTDPDLLIDLHWTVLQSRALSGKFEQSLESLGRALATPGLSGRQRARLLVLIALAHWNIGDVTVAGRLAHEALAAAESFGDTWVRGWALHALIIVSILRGDAAAALPLFDRALDVVGDDPALIDLGLLLQINHAVALGDLDRHAEALDVAERARHHADQAGSLVRLAQAHSALGTLLFRIGRWDDAQTEVDTLPDDFKDPSVVCWDRGISAVIAFHRGDQDKARQHLDLVASSAEQIGSRLIVSSRLAGSLDHEVAGEPGAALEMLVARVGESLDEMEDLLPDAARLAKHIGATGVAADIAEHAATLAQQSRVPHRLAAAEYCRGLSENDPVLLERAAERYDEVGLVLPRAKALEATAVSYAAGGDRELARTAFVRADDLFSALGASWDLANLRARLRRYGIRRGPRSKHREATSGWESLTRTEARIAGMVAECLSNRQIAEHLVLSTRTVETHVSHILSKLGVRSRVGITRVVGEESGRPGR